MENHLHAAGAIAALGVYPSLERPDVPVPMIATVDIAAVVAVNDRRNQATSESA